MKTEVPQPRYNHWTDRYSYAAAKLDLRPGASPRVPQSPELKEQLRNFQDFFAREEAEIDRIRRLRESPPE